MMVAHRISEGGSYRIDRRFKGVGRIALASGTVNKQRFDSYSSMLTELYEDGKLDVLLAIKAGRISLQQVYQAKRTGQIPYLITDLALHDDLWTVVQEWLPKSAAAEGSRKRYGVSFKSLRRYGPLSDEAKMSDLAGVDWPEVWSAWPAGPADWNRLRAAISRFLTMKLGDKQHPFRRKVLAGFPRAPEPRGRVPEITPHLLWRIVGYAPEHVKAAYITLAVTGLRPGEYLALEEHHLRPLTREIAVPGTKTVGSAAVIRVGERAWPWIVAAVPCAVRYKWLYTHWRRACADAGVPELQMRDLRHFYGQELTEAGRPEASVQQSLRHTDPTMTRRYTKRRDRGENAAVMDDIMFPQPAEKEAEER